jgi:hypothetical protein
MSAVLPDGLALFQSGRAFGRSRGYAKPPPRAESSNAFGVLSVSGSQRPLTASPHVGSSRSAAHEDVRPPAGVLTPGKVVQMWALKHRYSDIKGSFLLDRRRQT